MNTKRNQQTVAPEPPRRVEIETFCDPRRYWLRQVEQGAQSAWNGEVRIRKFRVIVEEVDEPTEVLAARLLALWRETDNHHHWGPLKSAAAKLGVELPDREWGIDVARKAKARG